MDKHEMLEKMLRCFYVKMADHWNITPVPSFEEAKHLEGYAAVHDCCEEIYDTVIVPELARVAEDNNGG